MTSITASRPRNAGCNSLIAGHLLSRTSFPGFELFFSQICRSCDRQCPLSTPQRNQSLCCKPIQICDIQLAPNSPCHGGTREYGDRKESRTTPSNSAVFVLRHLAAILQFSVRLPAVSPSDRSTAHNMTYLRIWQMASARVGVSCAGRIVYQQDITIIHVCCMSDRRAVTKSM